MGDMGYKLAGRRAVRFAASLGRARGLRARPRLAAKRGTACALLTFLALVPPLSADEALLKDGRRVPGELTLGDSGRLRFTPTDRDAPPPPADLASVRFAGTTPPPFHAASGFRV